MEFMLLVTIMLQVLIIAILKKILNKLSSKDKFTQIIKNSKQACIITDKQIIESIKCGKRIYCSRILNSDQVYFK